MGIVLLKSSWQFIVEEPRGQKIPWLLIIPGTNEQVVAVHGKMELMSVKRLVGGEDHPRLCTGHHLDGILSNEHPVDLMLFVLSWHSRKWEAIYGQRGCDEVEMDG